MKKHHQLSAAALTLLALSACQKKPAASETSATPEAPATKELNYIESSRGIVDSLQKQLSTKLKSTMKDQGAVAAIEVCANVAQPMTKSVSGVNAGQTISRTSLRVRNPKNAPDALSKRVLEQWQTALVENNEKPAAVQHTVDGEVIVHHPIIMQSTCLTCHGNPASIAPDVAKRLADLYPGDTATGFAEGDLRGAFRVKFEKDAQSAR